MPLHSTTPWAWQTNTASADRTCHSAVCMPGGMTTAAQCNSFSGLGSSSGGQFQHACVSDKPPSLLLQVGDKIDFMKVTDGLQNLQVGF